MGLEDEIEVTDDIGTADAIIASSYEMKQNPWIRGVAKFHQLPVFVMKVMSLLICSVCVLYLYMPLSLLGLIHIFDVYLAVKYHGTNREGSSYDS
jgi:hypothetical protein